MSLLKSVLYGFVSGLTEFLPVSSRGHQAVLRYLFGIGTRVPLQELLVHIGILIAIIISCRDSLVRLYRRQTMRVSVRQRKQRSKDKTYYDLRLLKTASFPLFAGLFFYFATDRYENNLLNLMAFWLLGGIVLLVADHTSRGNRDARTMSSLDGIVMGIAGALSVLPGISRTGMISAYCTARGADSENVMNWAVLLGIPAMIFAIVYDIVGLIAIGAGGSGVLISSVASGILSFGGAYAGIALLKMWSYSSEFSKFAYYSFGAALFSFILYLIT